MGLIKLDVVAIDGPAGSGKSTVARLAASRLGFRFMDTGAMYRAVALGAVEQGISVADTPRLAAYLDNVELDVQFETGIMHLYLNGRNVTEMIRQPGMERHASDFSTLAEVREFCSALQRRLGRSGKMVCEGRDMGTVVFPDARWKFFVTASAEERAKRRWKELIEAGKQVALETVRNDLNQRDLQDSNRLLAPLKPASDAMVVDTTDLTLPEVVEVIVAIVFSAGGN